MKNLLITIPMMFSLCCSEDISENDYHEELFIKIQQQLECSIQTLNDMSSKNQTKDYFYQKLLMADIEEVEVYQYIIIEALKNENIEMLKVITRIYDNLNDQIEEQRRRHGR